MQESLGLPDNNRNSAIVIKRVEKTTRFFLQLQPHLIPSFRDLCTSGNLSDYSLQTVFRCERTVCCLLFEIPIRILASNDAFMQFMKEEYPISKGISTDDRVNIAEFEAEDLKVGGRYYSLIKDLQVTDIVQFKDDCEEECYAIVVDITENQITTLKALIDYTAVAKPVFR